MMRAGVQHVLGGIVLSLLTGMVNAAYINITAEYNPAVYEASGAKFINTTPCTQSLVSWCTTAQTVDTPQAVEIRPSIQREVKINDDKRYGIHYLAFPAARDVVLTRSGGREAFPFKFILTDIGSHRLLDNPFTKVTEKGDCTNNLFSANFYANFTYSRIKESKQQSGGVCYSDERFLSRTVTVSSVYIGYKLKSADPLKMPNGTYTGKLIFSVGEYKDFDFGGGTYNDGQLTIYFTVKVKHQIKVEFPSGSNKVALQPPGGWLEWVHSGRVRQPPYLMAELPYRLWASSAYSVWLNCGFSDGVNCMLHNQQTGHKAKLYVYYVDRLKEMHPLKFITPTRFALEANGGHFVAEPQSLIFKVDKMTLSDMLKYPGSLYKGNVTIIYDAVL